MRYLVVVFALFGCDRTPAPDPWAGSAAGSGSSDPWGGAPPAAAAPSAAPAPSGGADTSRIDGTWKCNMLATTMMNGQMYFNPVPMPGFTIDHGSYAAGSDHGTIDFDGSYVTFHGDSIDGWRGAINTHDDGSLFIVFDTDTHRNAQPNGGAHNRDTKCER